MRPRLLVALAALASLLASACAVTPSDDADSEESESDLSTFVPPPAYAEGKLLSDLTPEIVTRLRDIHAASGFDDHELLKVGDSITFAPEFLGCFATTPVTGANAELEPTRQWFSARSWSRQSRASKVGWHTWQPYSGSPSPLDGEIADMRPAFAVVMLGTNDTYEGTQPSYERNLKRLVSALVDRGIVPVLSTIPPLRNAVQDAVVPKMNLIVRKVAAAARVPLMDFHLALEDVPRHGISGDGIHPFAARTGACDFEGAAMDAGYNQRNLLALRALDRVRRAVLDGADP